MATIKVMQNGPYLVQGEVMPVELTDHAGLPVF
jgi:hypothetical protein